MNERRLCFDRVCMSHMKENQQEKGPETPVFNETSGQNVQSTSAEVEQACAQDVAETDVLISIPKSEYDKLKQELDEAKDRGLRALAELENYRARTNRLHAEERKYASMDLARAILPVWDSLGLALQIDEPEKNGKAVLDGVKMVYDEFLNVLKKQGVEKIDALHKPFDPNFHESVAFMPSDEFPANTVLVELKAGFKLYDRVVRATQVVIAAQKPAESDNADSAS